MNISIRKSIRKYLTYILPIKVVYWWGLKREYSFWKKIISSKGKYLPDAYNYLMEDHELTSKIKCLIKRGKILEIGSGIISKIGNDSNYWILSTDILAEKYNRLLLKYSINKPSIIYADVENLNYSDKYFDLVYAENCIDHTMNPIKAIKEMLRVGKKVYLEHYLNVGKLNFYNGLHQWNFTVIKKDVYINSRKESYNLSKMFNIKYEINDNKICINIC